ncbi:OLC1v1018518C2 [Oldenlandia corymbosa var. corymbosa]|nr:OLC1v1018518C2 [Oldenlandia corymbosa var. corymbosa]
MNKGISTKNLQSILKKQNAATNKTSQKPSSHNWMTALRLGPKKTLPIEAGITADKCTAPATGNKPGNGTSDDAKKLAAAALQAVKDAAAAATGHGKVEVTEVRDFAGEEVEVKKLVDANSDKGKASVGPVSAVDAVLEQIRKKPKLSVLDKTKKDWGEYKDENKGVEEELETYKKSSNQYLDKVSFLQRADYREFERERDARLAMQSKRKQDMREDGI